MPRGACSFFFILFFFGALGHSKALFGYSGPHSFETLNPCPLFPFSFSAASSEMRIRNGPKWQAFLPPLSLFLIGRENRRVPPRFSTRRGNKRLPLSSRMRRSKGGCLFPFFFLARHEEASPFISRMRLLPSPPPFPPATASRCDVDPWAFCFWARRLSDFYRRREGEGKRKESEVQEANRTFVFFPPDKAKEGGALLFFFFFCFIFSNWAKRLLGTYVVFLSSA